MDNDVHFQREATVRDGKAKVWGVPRAFAIPKFPVNLDLTVDAVRSSIPL